MCFFKVSSLDLPPSPKKELKIEAAINVDAPSSLTLEKGVPLSSDLNHGVY